MTVVSLQVQESSLVATCSSLLGRSRTREGTQQEWWLPWKRVRKLGKALSPFTSILLQSRIAVTSYYSPVTSLVSPAKCGCYWRHPNSSTKESVPWLASLASTEKLGRGRQGWCGRVEVLWKSNT